MIRPASTSIIPIRLRTSELFPLPDRPQIATCCVGSMDIETFLSTGFVGDLLMAGLQYRKSSSLGTSVRYIPIGDSQIVDFERADKRPCRRCNCLDRTPILGFSVFYKPFYSRNSTDTRFQLRPSLYKLHKCVAKPNNHHKADAYTSRTERAPERNSDRDEGNGNDGCEKA